MNEEECRRALSALSPQIDRYANLLVRKGAAIKEGKHLVVQSPVETADFARRVVKAAYEAGAAEVSVIWTDEVVSNLAYTYMPLEHFKTTPEWKVQQLNGYAAEGASFLFLEGTNPNGFKGIDPAKPAAAYKARNTQCKTFREGMDYGHNVWCIAGVPVLAWARQVFSGTSDLEAIYHLWRRILEVARSAGEDPESEWETHNSSFEKTKRYLNQHSFTALRYEASNGTNLTIGLPKGHIWEGGAARTQSGTSFFPNIPTEEVFTSPERTKTEGIVYAALPLVNSGQTIKNFWFRFEEGRVVDFGAEQGKEVLQHILDTDENARYLGECALVSKNTPIRQSETLFYSTLYDENASCHLALGRAFPECIEGGINMDKATLLAHGLNDSATHVDFMIGTDDLNIWGISQDGPETPLFVNGQWSWE